MNEERFCVAVHSIARADSRSGVPNLEGLSATRLAEKTQAVEVIPPVEIRACNSIVAEIAPQLMPEVNQGSAIRCVERETDGGLAPGSVSPNTLSTHMGRWVELGDLHVRVESTTEGDINARANHRLLHFHPRGPPC